MGILHQRRCCLDKFLDLDRLEQHMDSLRLRLLRCLHVGVAGEQHAWRLGSQLSRRCDDFGSSVLLLQRKITEQQIECHALHRFARFSGIGRCRHLITLLLQDHLVRQQDRGLVIHHQNVRFAHCNTGSKILNVVPLPTRLRTLIFPAWFAMMPFTIHSPSPVPFSPFVLTHGSKMLCRISGGMPEPVSATRIWIQGCESSLAFTTRVLNRSTPPCPIASFALISRFEKTWLSWSMLATVSGSSPNSLITSMFAVCNCRPSNISVSSTNWLIWIGFTDSVLR